jgi:hypothetical protein
MSFYLSHNLTTNEDSNDSINFSAAINQSRFLLDEMVANPNSTTTPSRLLKTSVYNKPAPSTSFISSNTTLIESQGRIISSLLTVFNEILILN